MTFAGKLLTFLYPDTDGRKVFAVDLDQALGEGHFKLFDAADNTGLSLQEQLRRERMRLFVSGIAAYEWSSKAKAHSDKPQRLIVPLGGKVILYEHNSSLTVSQKVRVIYDGSSGDAVDPHLSPDGTKVAFVINDDLYALRIPSVGEAEVAVTVPTRRPANGSKSGVTCGLADYIAQEEMDRFDFSFMSFCFFTLLRLFFRITVFAVPVKNRPSQRLTVLLFTRPVVNIHIVPHFVCTRRYRGFWWSPDSSRIVYAEADETMVNHLYGFISLLFLLR